MDKSWGVSGQGRFLEMGGGGTQSESRGCPPMLEVGRRGGSVGGGVELFHFEHQGKPLLFSAQPPPSPGVGLRPDTPPTSLGHQPGKYLWKRCFARRSTSPDRFVWQYVRNTGFGPEGRVIQGMEVRRLGDSFCVMAQRRQGAFREREGRCPLFDYSTRNTLVQLLLSSVENKEHMFRKWEWGFPQNDYTTKRLQNISPPANDPVSL